MSDVACLCSAPIVGEARARGLDPMPLVAGLGLDLTEFEDPRGRIPWNAFVTFAERATKMLGEQTLEELAAQQTFESVPSPIRRVLPWIGDSTRLFTWAARWWGPWVFHGTRGRCETLPDGRLREIVQILPEYPACPEFLTGITGTLRAMPRLLGQSDAEVTLEQDGREGVYLITPPSRREGRSPIFSGRWPMRRAKRPPLPQAEEILAEIDQAREQLLESRHREASMEALLEEQSRCLGTLQQLGLSLVHDSDVDALQQDIVCLVEQQLGIGGARLSLYGDADDGSIRQTSSGRMTGEPAETLPLRVADRSLGVLEIWDAGDGHAPTSLHDLLPWIAIALENGRSKRVAEQLAMLLADDVADWERIERRLERTVATLDPPTLPAPERVAWPVDDLEPVDLAQFFSARARALRELAGCEVQMELHCADDLWPALFDEEQLGTLVENVIEVLRDIGSGQIWIDTRAVTEQPNPDLRYTMAEVRVRGLGGYMQPAAHARLRAALDFSDTGMLVADLDARSAAEGNVGVRIRLPLLAPAPGGQRH